MHMLMIFKTTNAFDAAIDVRYDHITPRSHHHVLSTCPWRNHWSHVLLSHVLAIRCGNGIEIYRVQRPMYARESTTQFFESE